MHNIAKFRLLENEFRKHFPSNGKDEKYSDVLVAYNISGNPKALVLQVCIHDTNHPGDIRFLMGLAHQAKCLDLEAHLTRNECPLQPPYYWLGIKEKVPVHLGQDAPVKMRTPGLRAA